MQQNLDRVMESTGRSQARRTICNLWATTVLRDRPLRKPLVPVPDRDHLSDLAILGAIRKDRSRLNLEASALPISGLRIL